MRSSSSSTSTLATIAPATRRMHASQSIAYTQRVNAAIDHIYANLASPIRLVSVARAAGLSPYHFHRVFQAMVGVTIADFAKRLRFDKALAMLAFERRVPIDTIAAECGFSSASDFSRSFKKRFGVSPRGFDIDAWRQSHRTELDALVAGSVAHHHLAQRGTNRARAGKQPFTVRLRELPRRDVAYIRVKNPYSGSGVLDAATRLVAWARRRGLERGQWLGYQWESPELVPLVQCRYHVGVEVPSTIAKTMHARGEVGVFRFPKMLLAEVEIRGGIDLELAALTWLYGVWLPASGYVLDDHPCFEAWIGLPFAHGTERFELRVQLPVRRAVRTTGNRR